MRTWSHRTTSVLLAFVAIGTAPAFGQTTAGINAGIQFDFSLPGARSLGMAGAFVARPDDATASQSNPAGLVLLTEDPEVSVEARGWNYYSTLPFQGHAFGNPTGAGLDTIAGLHNAEIKDAVGAISFLSFAARRGGWAFSAHRHQFADFKNTTKTDGPFFDFKPGQVFRINPSTGEIDIQIVNYGVSVAKAIGSERPLSIGATVAYSHFSIDSLGQAFLVIPNGIPLRPEERSAFQAPGQQYGPADYSPSNLFFTERQAGSDSGVAWTVGALFQANRNWNVGTAYRKGAKFEYDANFVAGPAHSLIGSPFAGVELDRDSGILFHVPDSFSLGASFSSNSGRLKINFEYDRVRYHQLLNGTGVGLPVDTAGRLQFPDPNIQEEGRLIVTGINLKSINEFRIGSEWAVQAKTETDPQKLKRFLLRVGMWLDPDHRVWFEDEAGGSATFPGLKALKAMLAKGDRSIHVSGGAGFGFRSFQIDGALDVSPRVNTLSISTVYYFNKRPPSGTATP
jgi:hypothetical protein